MDGILYRRYVKKFLDFKETIIEYFRKVINKLQKTQYNFINKHFTFLLP